MDMPVLLWPLGALLICWAVGVHSRLRRLRNACWLAVDNLDRGLQSLLQVAKEALDRPDPATRAHEALTIAALHLSLTLKTIKSATLMTGRDDEAQNLATQWSELLLCWQAFCEAHSSVIEVDALDALRLRWEEAHSHGLFAKATANQAMLAYNAAVQQAPARWIAARMGFIKATPL